MTLFNWFRTAAKQTPRAARREKGRQHRTSRRRPAPILEQLEDRVCMTVGTPAWVEQGPGPIGGWAVGAVNAVAVSPLDSNTMFAATVNGGIWETTNGGNASPTWTPLTDQLDSLAISAIAFSPLDRSGNPVGPNTPANQLVLYAGTGSLSSDGGQGGPAIGVLKSTDGGQTWAKVGGPTNPAGAPLTVLEVLPTNQTGTGGQTVLVGTNGSGGGVFRSTDGGNSFSRITSGLPDGAAVSMVVDATNPSTFYVAIIGSTPASSGIFRSDDVGADWFRVDNGAFSGGGAIPNLAQAQNIKLAVTSASGDPVVYAAVAVPQPDSNGLTVLGPNVYRSTDAGTVSSSGGSGGTWAAADSLANQHVLIGQASNLTLAADPNNSNLVYVGGDSDNSFVRGDFSQPAGSQWTAITGGNQANPHTDSRSVIVDPNGNLLETDDGGIFRRSNPTSNQGSWAPINGNLRVTEITGLGYDPINHVILAGTQDNGSIIQPGPGGFGWQRPLGGDGGISQAGVLPNGTVVYYYTLQFLGGFTRQIVDASGQTLSTTALAKNGLPVSGDSLGFYQPYVIDTADPTRLLTGTPGGNIYESQDMGDNFAVRTTASIGSVTALAYGGVLNGVANPDVAYVGSGGPSGSGAVYLRSTSAASGGTFQQLTNYQGSTPRDIVLDPDNWQRAYVIDDHGRVWRTVNAGANFGEITGNLASFFNGLTPDLRSIDCIDVGTAGTDDEALFIGGLGGVYATDTTAQGASTNWVRLGAGSSSPLPRALVTDVDYDPTTNQLIAGTLGRGAWTITNVSAFLNQLQTVNQPPVITVPGAQATDAVTNLVFSTANGNALSVADPDAGNNFEQVDLTVTGGKLALPSTATGIDVQRRSDTHLTFAGTLTSLNAALNGLTFTPPSQGGTVTLTITANDQGSSGTGGPQAAAAMVTINVAQANDAPVNTVPASLSAKPNTTVAFSAASGTAISVKDGDAGANPIQVTLSTTNGTLTVGSVASSVNSTPNGLATLTLTGPQAQINATLASLTLAVPGNLPDPSTVTLTVTTSDQGYSNPDGTQGTPQSKSSTIPITVTAANDAPVITMPAPQTTPVGTNLVFSTANKNAITVFDGDIGVSDSLQVTVSVSAGGVGRDGYSYPNFSFFPPDYPITVGELNGYLNGLIYTPPAGFTGPVTLTVDVNDLQTTAVGGAKETMQSLKITVGNSAQAPSVAVPDFQAVGQGGTLDFSSANGNGLSFSSSDTASMYYEITLAVAHGTLTLADPTGLNFLVGTGTGDPVMTFLGTQADLTAALNGLSYTPNPGFTGMDTLTITADDPGGGGDHLNTTDINIVEGQAGGTPSADAPADPPAGVPTPKPVPIVPQPPAPGKGSSDLSTTQTVPLAVNMPGFSYDPAARRLTLTGKNFAFTRATTGSGAGAQTTFTFTLDGNTESFPATQVSQVVVNGLVVSTAAPPGDPNAAFVTALYTTVLNRAPAASEVSAWVHFLQGGGTRQQVAQGFWESPEHRGIQVDGFYATLLHRTENSAERAAWVNAFLGGLNEAAVELLFLTSPEYTATHASAAAFVTGLYADLLGRPVDPAGQGWIPAAGNPSGRALVAFDILTSPELTKRVVDGFYLNLLRRPFDLANEQGWIALLHSNPAAQSAVAEAFLAAPEFFHLATLS
jgi:hypothetical protein